MRKYVMVDVEADGPCPGRFSMVQVGAVIVEPELDKTFLGYLRPISENWREEALNVCGLTRKETLQYPPAYYTMLTFRDWLFEYAGEKPMFISDNNGFDWQFVNYYFHVGFGCNPFGYSSTNLGSFYKGVKKDLYTNFKHLRKTKHDHNPLNDAIGNAEAFLEILKMIKLS